MGIVWCAACEGKVSDKLEICPHCGHPITRKGEDIIDLQLSKGKRIDFHCPKCNIILSVSDLLSGSKKICSNCGNVCIVPNPSSISVYDTPTPLPKSETQSDVVLAVPRMPGSITLGLFLYVVGFVLSLMFGLLFVREPEFDEELLGLACCVTFLLYPLEILGLVMACLGRRWGAGLFACIYFVGFILFFKMISVWDAFGIASVICFLLPESWDYYKKSDDYRRSK